MNYADHVAESHARMPEFPLYFIKPRTALVGHGAPLGPVVDTDVDGSDLAIQLRVNGEVKQKSRTSQLIFNVDVVTETLR